MEARYAALRRAVDQVAAVDAHSHSFKVRRHANASYTTPLLDCFDRTPLRLQFSNLLTRE